MAEQAILALMINNIGENDLFSTAPSVELIYSLEDEVDINGEE